jgi:hypothetical protein
MITVTELQEQARAAELHKRRQAERIGRDESVDPIAGKSEPAEARGFEHGPSAGPMPGHPEPEDFRRGNIDADHGAEAPMAEPPRCNPMPALPRGIVTPVALPDAPMAMTIPNHISAAFTSGSPSDR